MDINGKIIKVSVSNLSRICQSDSININDMAAVSPINTKDLLTNIKNRYNENIIFTNVGDTLIIVNPYQIIPGLYTEEKMKEIVDFSNENSVERYERSQPHCFDTTMHSIFDLLHQSKNQALVISGESGAGKTECAKLCMKFIAFYFGKKGEEGKKEENLEDKILACNPVLEAFGNAKTVRNDNSSRFGKYIKIFIKIETNQIVGAYMETYLLEKSRVVSISKGERNYHIFYQVLAGINELIKVNFDYNKIYEYCEKKRLKLSEKTKKYIEAYLTEESFKKLFNMEKLKEIKYESYNYLKNDVYTIPTIDDVFNFYECLEGMIRTGFKEEEMKNVIELIICLLNIGNIDFKEDPSGDKCTIHPDSIPIQKFVCDTMNIDYNIFKDAFLYNVRIIKKETIKSPMKKTQCIAFRDTFAKEIYNRLFGFLVKRMNLTLFDENIRKQIEDDDDIRHIGLLDIFGFECFKENSFEQFCINYANEKLQNLYVEDIFKEIENMFKRENLMEHYSQIQYKDNTKILNAMGKYPSGIFYQLDNECNVAQNDKNLLGRILAQAKTNFSIKSSLKNKDKFFICHTAKDVEYGINGFCTKNLDEFKLRMKESVDSIKDQLLQTMIGNNSGEDRHKKEKYLGGKFRSDMDNLAKALGECVRHYIRCLKPNEEKKKNYFVPWFSLLQIKYMGVLDTIRIRQEGYPVTKTYLEWYLKFEDAVDFPGKLFYKEVKEDNPKLKEWCHLIASKLIPDHNEDMILFGKTLILMRQTSSDKFESARKKALDSKQKLITLLANKIRGYEPVKSFHIFYNGIYTLQQNFKLFVYINRMNNVKEICKLLQTKSKMNIIKREHDIFANKLKQLKNFFISTNIKINSNKKYIQLNQAKYIIKNYVSNFKHKKYLKYKALVKELLKREIEKHIKSDITPAVIIIQKFVRGYLSKIKMGELYIVIVNKKKVLKEEIRVRKIQKHFRKHFYMTKVLKKQAAADKFVGMIKYHRFHTWYVNIRKNAIIIQVAYKKRYLRKKIIETRLREFTNEEDNKYEESTYVNSVNLFPERQIEKTPNEKGSQATLKKINNLQKFYDKKLQSLNPTRLVELPYLNHSQYDEPKLHFFAHILDLEAIINIDDIYVSMPWSETIQEIMSHNIEQNTPIQLIEVGEFHTTLVNSLGKAFTWGWNGNGQCAFNMNKDKNFLYKNFKGNKNEKNKKFDLKNIDFDKEIENIKNGKEILENGIEDVEIEDEDKEDNSEENKLFNDESFTDYYYLDSPIILDNFNIRKISCGQDNTMILTKENKLYVFGANNYYQLGVIKNRNIYSPTSFQNIIKGQQENVFVNMKSNITQMKFSGKNALLLNDSGNLIMLSCFDEDEELSNTPKELYVPNAKFSQIECGKDFCLLLTKSGILYSFGKNQFGQLGHGDNKQRTYPTPVKFFLDLKKKVDQISCGFKHSACKCNNKIYSWGCNLNGQLGTGNLKHMYTPYLNDIKYSKIKSNFLQVSCGFRSTVFLTETRKLYWCGTCGDIQQQLEPIEFIYNKKIPELFSYENHVIVKINHTWSKTISILYATIAEIGPLKRKLNNPNKLNKILNNLTNKWIDKDLYPPIGEDLVNYIAEKHLIKDKNVKNLKKNKK